MEPGVSHIFHHLMPHNFGYKFLKRISEDTEFALIVNLNSSKDDTFLTQDVQ